MTYPPYPRENTRAARLYAALCAAGSNGLGRQAAARAFSGSKHPSADSVSQIGRNVTHLRPFLRRHDLAVVIAAGRVTFAEAWRIVPLSDAEHVVERVVDPAPGRAANASPAFDIRIVGGQRISLPRLTCLGASSREARPC